MGGGCLFPVEVMSMGTWKQTEKGFTANNERVSSAFVDVIIWHVFASVANLHQQPKIKKPPR